MNQYFEQHEERKNKIMKLLDDVSQYLAEQEHGDDADALRKLREDMEQGLFSIVLIGEFSAGKSTFLNALMHKRILPSYKKETTATVNFLRHQSKAPNGEKGLVYYRNGEVKELTTLDVETLEKFVSTRGDNEQATIAKTVEKVDLFLESKLLEDGVMLVDSPGLNGVAENLEAITKRQIKESHACIFMFSADHPGTRTDFDTLRDLRQQCGRIFIVLNKIDTIKKEEHETVESIVEALKNSYRKQFPDAKLPEIYPVAAEQALIARDESHEVHPDTDAKCKEIEKASRMEEFEDRLFRYLVNGEKAREQFQAPLGRAILLLQNQREELDAQIEALSNTQSMEELTKQKEEFEDKIAELEKERKDSIKPLQERFQRVMRDFKDKSVDMCERITNNIKNESDAIEEVDELKEYAQRIPSKLENQYKKLAANLADDLQDDLISAANEISDDYLGEIQEAIDDDSAIEFKFSSCAVPLTEVEVGQQIEAAEKAFAEKQKKMKCLEEELDELQKDRAKAKKIELHMESLQQELRDIAQQKIHIEETFTIPDVDRRTKKVKTPKPYGGILGGLLTILIGPKMEEENQEYDDSTAHDEAVQQKNQKLIEVDEARAEVLREMEKYKNEDADSEVLNVEIESRKHRLNELRNDYKEDVQKHIAALEKDAEKACKKLRSDIAGYAEEQAEDGRRAIDTFLRVREQKTFSALQTMVAARIQEEIGRWQARLDRLIADSKASDAERDEKLQRAKMALDRASELLGIGAELEEEINSDMNDVIKEAWRNG